jgi:hypothetical protein
MFASVAVSVIGLIAIAAGSKRLGAGLVIGGSVLFVPIGMIAALGGRMILDATKRRAFYAESL